MGEQEVGPINLVLAFDLGFVISLKYQKFMLLNKFFRIVCEDFEFVASWKMDISY